MMNMLNGNRFDKISIASQSQKFKPDRKSVVEWFSIGIVMHTYNLHKHPMKSFLALDSHST